MLATTGIPIPHHKKSSPNQTQNAYSYLLLKTPSSEALRAGSLARVVIPWKSLMVRGTLENENDPRTTANAIPTNTNGITEKFFGNHLNLSCLRFVSTKTTTIWTSSCSPVYHFPPKTAFTEHTIFDFTEKGKGSRGYLKKYLFSTPLHLDSLVDVYVFFPVSLSTPIHPLADGTRSSCCCYSSLH